MTDATLTVLIGTTFDKKQVEAIDKLLEQMNVSLPKNMQHNRQDFIRMAVVEKIAQMEEKEAGVKL